jgi:hypothetical protein
MRLWLSPYTYRSKPVWIGQISRDIGLRFTLRSAFLTTHKIDPQVDEARDHLVQDLPASESLEWLAYVKGVGPVSAEAPTREFDGRCLLYRWLASSRGGVLKPHSSKRGELC